MKKKWLYIIVSVVVVLVAVLLATRNQTADQKTTATSTKGGYIALGDSVAAGVGLKDYSDSSACNRTDESYPKLVAANLQYRLTNLACSGATIAQGITGKQTVNQLALTPQLDALFGRPKPKLITLTIGANDVGWTSILTRCYTATCGTAQDEALVQGRLQTVGNDLTAFLQSLQSHYGTSLPRVAVTGYYQPFPASLPTNCADLIGVDATELSWARAMQSQISDTIMSSVKEFTFATYVPVNFGGHELCSADPWVQGLQAAAPYHPTGQGQRTIARQIEEAIQ